MNNIVAALFVVLFGGTCFLLGRFRQVVVVWRDGYRAGSADHWRSAVRATGSLRRAVNQRPASYDQPARPAPRPRHLASLALMEAPTAVMEAPTLVDLDGPTVWINRAA